MALRFKFNFKPAKDGILVNTITKDDEEFYGFSHAMRHSDNHPELFTYSAILNGVKGIAKERNLWVTLKEEHASLYTDTDGNFRFKKMYLDETENPKMNKNQIDKKSEPSKDDTWKENFLLKMKCLEDQLATAKLKNDEIQTNTTTSNAQNEADNWMWIEKRLLIEKFDCRQDGKTWLESLETEFERLKVEDERVKVKVLGSWVDDKANEWYMAKKQVFGVADWTKYKESFEAVFGCSGWSKSRWAYNIRFVTGSIHEYALKKQRLLIEDMPSIQDEVLVKLIVFGLPEFVQVKLDKSIIKTPDKLLNELSNFENVKIVRRFEDKTKNTERKPFTGRRFCKACKRYHAGDCDTRKNNSERATNLTEQKETNLLNELPNGDSSLDF